MMAFEETLEMALGDLDIGNGGKRRARSTHSALVSQGTVKVPAFDRSSRGLDDILERRRDESETAANACRSNHHCHFGGSKAGMTEVTEHPFA
jgi:hypothetical protein